MIQSPVCLSICRSVCLSVCLFVRPSICPSVRLSVCLSVCLSCLWHDQLPSGLVARLVEQQSTVICSEDRGFGIRIFLLLHVDPVSFLGPPFRRYRFGYLCSTVNSSPRRIEDRQRNGQKNTKRELVELSKFFTS